MIRARFYLHSHTRAQNHKQTPAPAESSADEGGRDGSEEVGSKENVGSTFADGRGPTSNATEGDVTGDGDAATANAADDGAAEAPSAADAPSGPEAGATDAAASS